MPDGDGTESISTDTSSEVTQEQTSGPADTSGGNPAWDSVRSKIDPMSFKLIEEDLKGFDRSANSRVESLNAQLKEFSALGTPQQLKDYATIAQQIDANPEIIYNALGEFLQANGRMPSKQELKKEVDEDVAEEQQSQQGSTDPRIDQMLTQQQQMAQFLQNQQLEAVQREADSALDQEINSLKAAHPEFDDEDMREVLQRAAFKTQATGRYTTLDEAAKEYIEKTVNRIRTAPRAGDNAPRLVPTSGGVPTGQNQQSLGSMSRGDVQGLVAGILSGNKG